MRTMVATNQRDYATISHMDMTDSPDKSSCRSATINNNIWTPAGATLLHLTRSFASRRVAQRSRTCYVFRRPRPFRMRAVSRDNKSIDERYRYERVQECIEKDFPGVRNLQMRGNRSRTCYLLRGSNSVNHFFSFVIDILFI